jgi:short repeat uncharacterized protein DUF308
MSLYPIDERVRRNWTCKSDPFGVCFVHASNRCTRAEGDAPLTPSHFGSRVVYLIARPALGFASLTLVLASLFLVEGISDIALLFRVRPTHGSSWVLIDGIVTLGLGLMIYLQWPSSSAWAIGTLVGVSMIMSGVTRVMVSLAVRRAEAAISPSSPSSLAA